jgi:NAD(P)-dependent dehydrogenase (short-subunit alcohol dehydrogenase family)
MPPPAIDLTDRVAVVTGAGAGIGQGCAVSLARCGADVVVAEIDPARAEQTVALVREQGREALAVPVDVLDSDQIRAAIAAADDRFGRIDILVNNAGGVRGRLFLEQSERSWRRHIDINLVSVLAATSAALPVMIRGGRGGSVVNVASIEAFRAAPTFSVYAACKAAMVSLTKTFAVELAEHGVRVNCIAPDMTITPGNHGQRTGPVDPTTFVARPPQVQAALDRYIPVGREGIVAECGDVVAFLCSASASYVTGATIPVDGGTAAAGGWVRAEDRAGWDLGAAPIARTAPDKTQP